MFKNEFKRAITRNSTLIVLLIGILLAIGNVINNNVVQLPKDEYWDYPFGVFTWWFMYDQDTYKSLIITIFPLMVAAAYSDSYMEDVKTGFIKNLITRYSKKKYLTIRFLTNFLMGGIILTIPFIFNLLLYLLLIPNIEPNIFYGAEVVKNFLPHLYYSSPIVHAFIKLLICFIYGGLFSSIALIVSIFTKNRITIIVAPLLVFQIVELLVTSLKLSKLSSLNIMFYDVPYSSYIFLVPLVFLIVLFSCFFIRGIYHEDF